MCSERLSKKVIDKTKDNNNMDSSSSDNHNENDNDSSSFASNDSDCSVEISRELSDWNGQLSLSWASVASGL